MINYFISLCLLNPLLFIGKFVDSETEGETKMEWLGFLKDEFIHFKLGFQQVALFGMVLFLGCFNMLLPTLRLFKPELVSRIIKIF